MSVVRPSIGKTDKYDYIEAYPCLSINNSIYYFVYLRANQDLESQRKPISLMGREHLFKALMKDDVGCSENYSNCSYLGGNCLSLPRQNCNQIASTGHL